MKTIYYTASSLDGYIADAHHSLDWLFQFSDAPGGSYEELIKTVGAIAMGASTYEWLLKHEILADPDHPKPWPYSQPTWVFSHRVQRELPGVDIRFVSGDVVAVHRDMTAAAKGGDIWVVGGGDLVGQFHDSALLDEIIVTFAAVTLGAGAPLLPRRITTPPLRLLSATQYGPYAELRYEVQRVRP